MAQRAIFLVGMMGSGKSTIGRALARELGLKFIDCDRELELRSGVTITTMFEVEGELSFREREAALIDELTRAQQLVQRFLLPQLHAMNFVLDDVLDGGVNDSLNLDSHGKALSFHLLSLPVKMPAL